MTKSAEPHLFTIYWDVKSKQHHKWLNKSTYSATVFTFIFWQYKETSDSPLSAHLTSQTMIQNCLTGAKKKMKKMKNIRRALGEKQFWWIHYITGSSDLWPIKHDNVLTRQQAQSFYLHKYNLYELFKAQFVAFLCSLICFEAKSKNQYNKKLLIWTKFSNMNLKKNCTQK